MSVLSKFNKNASVDWEVDTSDYEYKKCSDLEINKDYLVKGCFITPDNGYGQGAVLIMDGFCLNIPQGYVNTINEIRNDAEAIAEIKAGKCYISLSTYAPKKFPNKTAYHVTFK